jgi:hypothetical protein
MLIAVVTNGTEIVIATLGAFPSYPENGLLTARIAHCTVVLDPCRCRIQYAQVKGTGTSIIGCRTIIPYNHDLLWRFKVSHGAYVTFSTILANAHNLKIINNA